jgi:hypothetical protein
MDVSDKDIDKIVKFEMDYESSIHHPVLGMITPNELSAEGDCLVVRQSDDGSCEAVGISISLVFWSYFCILVALTLIHGVTTELIFLNIIMFGSWLALAWRAIWNLYVHEVLRIGPDGVDYHVRRPLTQFRQHLELGEIAKFDLDSEPLSLVLIRLKNDAKPIELNFGRSTTKRRWLAGVLQTRLGELKQFYGLPGRPELTDHKTLATSVQASDSSRRIFIPGLRPMNRPHETKVEIDERAKELTISVTRFKSLFSTRSDEVLCINSQHVWHKKTSLRKKPKAIPLNRIKAIGIDDPQTGTDCADEFAHWGKDHVILVFLDYRRVKIAEFPVYTNQEADWLADLILRRFPQMFDPAVLPKQAGE